MNRTAFEKLADPSCADKPRCLFLTGKLAEFAVRQTVASSAAEMGFSYEVQVLPITVAALMTPQWLLRKSAVPESFDLVFVPGYLTEHVDQLADAWQTEVIAGPRDIRDLPEFIGLGPNARSLDEYNIEIIAEINHANRLPENQIIETAQSLIRAGADRIDLGCTPGERWQAVESVVTELIANGIRVSIDSFDPDEVGRACKSGADLVLSVNSTNRAAALDWNAEVVVIPDTPEAPATMYATAEFLDQKAVPFRLDPILEPIGCGFANSLQRYVDCRREFRDSPMMMGIGNLTELTDVDSAGINVLLLGFCQELDIGSVLTTQVINWARSSVKECHAARRLVHYAVAHQTPPKRLSSELVMLRDDRVNEFELPVFEQLAQQIRDKNVRIFTREGQIHLITQGVHLHDADPFALMNAFMETDQGSAITASHAFYLGFELSKAQTANTLHKQYTQDVALDWGMLTAQEKAQRIRHPSDPKQ